MDRVVQVLTLMTEGMSIRAISRVTDIHKTTILSLLKTVGTRCAVLLDTRLHNLRPRYIQADEAWTFVQKKQKRLTLADPAERGDQYVWLALDSEAKLIMPWRVWKRDGINAYEFVGDLSRRIAEQHRPQPRTDGPDWFRPSSHVVAAVPTPISGDPEMARISTSHIERLNLTVRMHLRRFTRLTNGFSKTLASLQATVAVFVAWYNFCRVHQTLRVTPAMEAGLTDHIWTLRELLIAA